jgi:hypothetical protein
MRAPRQACSLVPMGQKGAEHSRHVLIVYQHDWVAL